MTDEEKAQWEVNREKVWRETWCKFVNVLSADSLKEMFLSGGSSEGYIVGTFIPDWYLEDYFNEIDVEPTNGFDKAWLSLTFDQKQEVVKRAIADAEAQASITAPLIDEIVTAFSSCIDKDEEIEEEEGDDLPEGDDDDDDDDITRDLED